MENIHWKLSDKNMGKTITIFTFELQYIRRTYVRLHM